MAADTTKNDTKTTPDKIDAAPDKIDGTPSKTSMIKTPERTAAIGDPQEQFDRPGETPVPDAAVRVVETDQPSPPDAPIPGPAVILTETATTPAHPPVAAPEAPAPGPAVLAAPVVPYAVPVHERQYDPVDPSSATDGYRVLHRHVSVASGLYAQDEIIKTDRFTADELLFLMRQGAVEPVTEQK